MVAKGQRVGDLQPGTYIARPKSIRASPLDPTKRKQQKILGATSKRGFPKKIVGLEQVGEDVNELNEIARVLKETRKMAANRPIEPRGISDFENKLRPVVKAMERQVGWSARYNRAANTCRRSLTHYEKLMRKSPRESTQKKYQTAKRLCNVYLQGAYKNLIEARESFAPCFCPSGSTDPAFEYVAMVERFKKGRPTTFEETRLQEAGERFARATAYQRPKGKRGRRSLAEIRAIQAEHQESLRDSWQKPRPETPEPERYKYPRRTVKRTMTRRSSAAQRAQQAKMKRAAAKCKGQSQSKFRACMKRELKG